MGGNPEEGDLMAGVTKVTTIDSPEKIRARNMGYSLIIHQIRAEPSMKRVRKTTDNPTTK